MEKNIVKIVRIFISTTPLISGKFFGYAAGIVC